MHKFVTRDDKVIKLNVDPDNEDVLISLNNVIPRLSYDEILDGELEKRLDNCEIRSLQLSSGDDVKTLILSYAMFNAISKTPGA